MRDREKYMQREIGIKTRIKGKVTHTHKLCTRHTQLYTHKLKHTNTKSWK